MLFATGCGALTVDTPLLAALQHGFTVFAMSCDWGGVGGRGGGRVGVKRWRLPVELTDTIYFRVVDADSSNCDFTIRFIIRVHGLPPGSLNPSSVIVLVSLTCLRIVKRPSVVIVSAGHRDFGFSKT